MNHLYKSWDVVAYTYAATIRCAGCTREALIADGKMSPGARGMDFDTALWQVLEANGFDSDDETQWDSDDLPKVVFVDQVTNDDLCDECGGGIL